MSYALLCFLFKAWVAGRGWSDFDSVDVHNWHSVLFIKLQRGCHVRDAVVAWNQHRFCFHCRIVFSVLSCPVLATMKHGIYQHLDTLCVCVCVPLQYNYCDYVLSAVISHVSVKNIYFAAGSSLWEASSLMHSIDYFIQLICMWRAGVQRCAVLHIDKEWHFTEDQLYWFLVCFFLPSVDDNLRLVLTNATREAVQPNANNGFASSAF